MESLKEIKTILTEIVHTSVQDLSNVNVCELGEVIDMIKDLSEAMYYCSVVKAMEEEHQENVTKMMTTISPTTK